MYLQKLEIQGFKSFASKTVFSFPPPRDGERGVTGVVGPNGSGKSNVADAIRWVLGEQSKTALRSKKAEDVIFFGSARKSQLGFCEVSLTFNNEDGTRVGSAPEIMITRRLYRDGESEFLLNGAKVRLADVVMLIAQAQCGPKNISVIGQGMIDSIINATPAERKDYFDEAAGVKQYHLKKDQSLQKLKNTRENLDSARLLVSELEPKIRFFSRLMKRLQERSAIEQQLSENVRSYYNVLWESGLRKLGDSRSRQSQLQRKIDDAQKSADALDAEFQEKKNGLQPQKDDAFRAFSAEHARLSAEKQELLKRQALIEGRLKGALQQTGKVQLSWLLEQERLASGSLAETEATAIQLEKRITEHSQEERRLLEACAQNVETPRHETLTLTGVRENLLEILKLKEGVSTDSLNAAHAIFERVFSQVHALVERIGRSVSAAANTTSRERDSHQDAPRRLREELARVRIALGVDWAQLQTITAEITRKKQELEKLRADCAYFSSQEPSDQHDVAQKEKQVIDERLAECSQKLRDADAQLAGFYEKEKQTAHTLLSLSQEVTAARTAVDAIKENHTVVSLEVARAEAHQEELLLRICEEFSLDSDRSSQLREATETVYSVLGFQRDPEPINVEEVRVTIERAKKKLEQIGSIDDDALAEYESTKERYEFLTAQIADLDAARESLTVAVKDLNSTVRQRFDDALIRINETFDQYFKILFSGGSARISVLKRESPEQGENEDEEAGAEHDDAEEIMGIEIYCNPPQKKLKNISFLSGGEKAMTAIALLCAIVSSNPAPFVVLDEVDASLDDSNAHRFADIISELVSKTQFIIITHNRVTIHTAQVLYGVTMGDDGVSKVLSLDIENVPATISQS